MEKINIKDLINYKPDKTRLTKQIKIKKGKWNIELGCVDTSNINTVYAKICGWGIYNQIWNGKGDNIDDYFSDYDGMVIKLNGQIKREIQTMARINNNFTNIILDLAMPIRYVSKQFIFLPDITFFVKDKAKPFDSYVEELTLIAEMVIEYCENIPFILFN